MMGLQWYLMGMLTVFAWNGFQRLRKQYVINWKATVGILAAFGCFWMSFGWSWSSYLEGEPQSAAMGLAMFGLLGLIISAITWRQFIKPNPV